MIVTWLKHPDGRRAYVRVLGKHVKVIINGETQIITGMGWRDAEKHGAKEVKKLEKAGYRVG